MDKNKHLSNFLFEIGTLRKLPRSHRQTLHTNDVTDNISSHKFRVTWIGWFLAKMENVDPYKVVMMCLMHDLPETRSGDQNWVHKKYVKVFEDEIINDQLKDIDSNNELINIYKEYDRRETLESNIAKDADLIEQILLLKEHAHTGNKEAENWLQLEDFENKSETYKGLKTKSGKTLAKQIANTDISEWWQSLYTRNRR